MINRWWQTAFETVEKKAEDSSVERQEKLKHSYLASYVKYKKVKSKDFSIQKKQVYEYKYSDWKWLVITDLILV